MGNLTHLADACALIAFLGEKEPELVMPRAALIMRSGEVAVLPTTVWEITRKAALGKLPRFWTPWPSLPALLSEQQFRRHPIEWKDGETANMLAEHHRDPMDRMLIAVALRTGMPVITSDQIFGAYGVSTVW